MSTTRAAASLSHTPRQALRRARGWIVLIVVLLVGGAIVAAVQLSLATTSVDVMGASNPGQQGGQALARVLAQHGVEVHAVESLTDARAAASSRAGTTVLLSDPNAILDAAQLRSVLAVGAHVVVIDPTFAQLQALAPAVQQGGAAASPTSTHAGCVVRAARDAGSLGAISRTFRLNGGDGQRAVGCFRVRSGGAGSGSGTGSPAYAFAQTSTRGTTVSVVGKGLFENQHIGTAGNAALAIGLLGAHRTLVWYLPSPADAVASGPPTLAEITPGWLTPSILLLIAVVIAAAVWRGRRFGPLVVEDLPVVVRAGETVQGRARLYRTARARVHAGDALRIGALRRIAALAGLPASAHVDQVVAAAAALTGRPAEAVQGILLTSTPQTDADLRSLASDLSDLERDVRSAVSSQGGGGPGVSSR